VKASIVIPVLNGGEIFRQVVDRVLGQKTNEEYEVIIVDSGSTDGSVEYIRSKQSGPVAVTLKEIPKAEFGHGKTRNLGASLSKAEFIAFLTQDALPADQHWLQNLVSAVVQDPDIAGAFGKHLPYPDCHPLTSRDIHAHMKIFDNAPHVVWLEDKERYKSDLRYRQFLHFFSNNNSCMRRSIWRRIPFSDVPYGEEDNRKGLQEGLRPRGDGLPFT
jgi:rhamnosyltransferase